MRELRRFAANLNLDLTENGDVDRLHQLFVHLNSASELPKHEGRGLLRALRRYR
jgi:hypothetical protein